MRMTPGTAGLPDAAGEAIEGADPDPAPAVEDPEPTPPAEEAGALPPPRAAGVPVPVSFSVSTAPGDCVGGDPGRERPPTSGGRVWGTEGRGILSATCAVTGSSSSGLERRAAIIPSACARAAAWRR